MALLSLYALFRIQNYSKPLQKMGVSANTQIMSLYAISWVGTASGAWIQLISNINYNSLSGDA